MSHSPAPIARVPRTRLAWIAAGLYAAVAVALCAMALLSLDWHAVRDHGFPDGMWWFGVLPGLYAAGLAHGALRLEVRPRRTRAPRWIFGLMALHGAAGLGGVLALVALLPGVRDRPLLDGIDAAHLALPLGLAALFAMLLAAPLALWLPAHARRSGAFLLWAVLGGFFALANFGLLVLGLLLTSHDRF